MGKNDLWIAVTTSVLNIRLIASTFQKIAVNNRLTAPSFQKQASIPVWQLPLFKK